MGPARASDLRVIVFPSASWNWFGGLVALAGAMLELGGGHPLGPAPPRPLRAAADPRARAVNHGACAIRWITLPETWKTSRLLGPSRNVSSGSITDQLRWFGPSDS